MSVALIMSDMTYFALKTVRYDIFSLEIRKIQHISPRNTSDMTYFAFKYV